MKNFNTARSVSYLKFLELLNIQKKQCRKNLEIPRLASKTDLVHKVWTAEETVTKYWSLEFVKRDFMMSGLHVYSVSERSMIFCSKQCNCRLSNPKKLNIREMWDVPFRIRNHHYWHCFPSASHLPLLASALGPEQSKKCLNFE